MPAGARADFPALDEDFDVLEKEVAGAFAEFDLAALRGQNSYRRQQVLILLGAAFLTGLGGLQAVFPEQRWPGIVLAVLGVLVATSTRLTDEQESKRRYLEARVKAERLRALHFLYLSRTGPFAGADRQTALRRSVLAIRAGKEPA